MEIIVNGKKQTVDNNATLRSCIEKLCAQPERVIAEVNEQIVKREEWKNLSLREGDHIELVTFVGGG